MFALGETEACAGGEVAAFHDAAEVEDFGVGFVDVVKSGGAFEVGV